MFDGGLTYCDTCHTLVVRGGKTVLGKDTYCGETCRNKGREKIKWQIATMHRKLTDTVAWLDRGIKSGNPPTLWQLTEARDDLAETLRKIGEG